MQTPIFTNQCSTRLLKILKQTRVIVFIRSLCAPKSIRNTVKRSSPFSEDILTTNALRRGLGAVTCQSCCCWRICQSDTNSHLNQIQVVKCYEEQMSIEAKAASSSSWQKISSLQLYMEVCGICIYQRNFWSSSCLNIQPWMLPPSLEAVFDQFINKLASCEWAAGVRCKMICRFGQRFLTAMCSFSYSRVVLPVSVEEVRTYSFTLIPSVMDTVTIGIFHLLAPYTLVIDSHSQCIISFFLKWLF